MIKHEAVQDAVLYTTRISGGTRKAISSEKPVYI